MAPEGAGLRFGRKLGLALGANFGSLWAQTARVPPVRGGGLIGAVSGYLCLSFHLRSPFLSWKGLGRVYTHYVTSTPLRRLGDDADHDDDVDDDDDDGDDEDVENEHDDDT